MLRQQTRITLSPNGSIRCFNPKSGRIFVPEPAIACSRVVVLVCVVSRCEAYSNVPYNEGVPYIAAKVSIMMSTSLTVVINKVVLNDHVAHHPYRLIQINICSKIFDPLLETFRLAFVIL